jgi:hypothetical protein
MAAHVLVVATETATSDELMAALKERVSRGTVPVDFMLVMPASGVGTSATEPKLQAALEHWREAGLKADGIVGDSLPVNAVAEVCRPGRFDEVIVCTLPGQTSRWLRSDVPYRISALTDLPVTHVVALSMLQHAPHGEPPPPRERRTLGMLNVMAYRGSHPQK